MGDLWITELANGNDMMYIRFLSEFFLGSSTVFTAVIVPIQRSSSYFSPFPVVDVLVRSILYRKREG